MRPHHHTQHHPGHRASPEHRRQPSPSRSSRGPAKHSPGREMRPPHPQDPMGHHLPPPHPHPGHPGQQEAEGPTPICRCRVLYLGSSVPHVTKDGLQGIQEPLKELYPEDGALGAKGIDSWLSVWSNGFLLENVDENRKKVSRFFPIDSLHYCAAVRYVQVPGTSGEKVQRFLPLDSPFARNPNINHPPLFAAILRRTTGIKVLECHVFICKRETAANALVRCSFHAYADSTYAKHLENGASLYGTVGAPTPTGTFQPNGEVPREFQQSVMEMSDDSMTSLDPHQLHHAAAAGAAGPHDWAGPAGGQLVQTTANISPVVAGAGAELRPANGGVFSHNQQQQDNGNGNADGISVFNGDENHKVWAQKEADLTDGIYGDYGSTMRSFRSSASGLSTRQRPRQMMMQSPPPPPIPEELVIKEGKEERKKKKKSKSRDVVDGDMMPPLLNGSVTNLNGGPSNGSVINGGRASSVIGGRKMSAGSFIGINSNGRPPMNGGPPRGGPPMAPYGPPGPGGFGPPPPMMMMPGPGPRGKKGGTFSGRQKGMKMPMPPYLMYGPGPGMPPGAGPMLPPGMPPHLLPPPGHPLYGQPVAPGPFPHPMAGGRPDSQVMEEPIYMPHNARPLSPVASYQPGHFPHDAYYSQQQYATIDKNGKYRHREPRQERKQKGSSKHSKQQSSAESNAEDSEGTGIYKKGYINERAFAHSMRNEQRSRSYGSLANLQFDPAGEVLGPGDEQGSAEEVLDDRKKPSREMMHMMDNLDLDDDAIERSEVPAGFYPPPRAYRGLPPPHPGMNGVAAGAPVRRHRR